MNQHMCGVLFIHMAPRAFCPHIEWTVRAALSQEVKLDWTVQGAEPRLFRAEYPRVGPVGAGAKLASGLRGWEDLYYEVTEETASGFDGSRWTRSPELGIFYAQTDSVGNAVVPEGCILAALERAEDPAQLRRGLDLALGRMWDEELEPYRWAGVGAPVRYLCKVSWTRSFIFWRGIGTKTSLELMTFIYPGATTTNNSVTEA